MSSQKRSERNLPSPPVTLPSIQEMYPDYLMGTPTQSVTGIDPHPHYLQDHRQPARQIERHHGPLYNDISAGNNRPLPVHVDERARRLAYGQKSLPAPSAAATISQSATSDISSYHTQSVYSSRPPPPAVSLPALMHRVDSPFQTRYTSGKSPAASTIQTLETSETHGFDTHESSLKHNNNVFANHGTSEHPTPSGITNGSVPAFRVAPQNRNTGHFEAQRYRASIHPSDEASKATNPARSRYRRRSSPPPYLTASTSTSFFSLRSDDKSPDEAGAESDINYVVFSATGDLEKTHICPHCLKRFNRPSSLQIHVNTHTGATPFKCPWPSCGREFNVNSNMKRHYRGHTEPGVSRKTKGSGRRRKGLDDDDPSAAVSISTRTSMRNETSASDHPDSEDEDEAYDGVDEEEDFDSQEEPYPESETPGPSTSSQYSGQSPPSSPTSQPVHNFGRTYRDSRIDTRTRYTTWASTSQPSSFNDSPAPPSALMGYDSKRSRHVKKEDGRQ